MAPARNLDSRWVRRYRVFFIVGSIILCIQVFLYSFFTISSSEEENSNKEERELFGKGKLQREANIPLDSSKKLDTLFVVDDEDSPSNSNPVNGLYSKPKVPPDKFSSVDNKNVDKVPKIPNKGDGLYSVNRTSLNLDDLDFIPICDIVTKEAVSAIHRAKTQRCKQKIANITCLIQQGQLYPQDLPNSCISNGYTPGKSLGCYRDEKKYRLLNGYFATFKSINSPQHCINMCLQSGFPYAGVQYSIECFCGNEEPPSTSRVPDSSCNMKCPADSKEACGGYLAINIYETGIAKFVPQVPKESSDVPTTPIRIAFLLTLNGRALRQVKRLIKVLFHLDHFFYIHVDARQDYLFRELLVLEQKFPNIRLARQRYATIWGGASLLQMLLTAMNELLKSEWKWDFVINLSESDFPVKTNAQLVDFLTANKGRNFVKSHGREVQRFIQKQGLDKTFVECDAHMWRVGDRLLPWGIQIDGGSDWVALSKQFVHFVTSVVDEDRQNDKLIEGLNVVFRHTLLPAETFFHTALRNSPFCDTYIDNNLHVTNWKRRLGCKCQYKHVVDWCGCSPNDFKLDDWPRLQATEGRQLFFARKFEPVISQSIIDQVEEWLYGSYPTNIPNLRSYWQNIYHHADLSPPPDDAVMTIGTSLARTALRKFSAMLHCEFEVKKLLEITSYHEKDNYKGSLILYEALLPGNVVLQLETLVQPEYRVSVKNTIGPVSRLKTLLVSSEYDQKEQIARNFLGALGPFSQPTLVYEFHPDTAASPGAYNITFLWVDPIGEVLEVSEVHVDNSALAGGVKTALHEPLLPGIWELKMVLGSSIVAEVQFLVTPIEFISGVALSQQQIGYLHNGPSQLHITPDIGDWNKVLNKKQNKSALSRKAMLNAMRFGVDLREWIDSFTHRFYKILDSCIATKLPLPNKGTCGQLRLDSCDQTTWSSFSPDPKSNIGAVNSTTGKLNRW